jgi:hypothetical protein
MPTFDCARGLDDSAVVPDGELAAPGAEPIPAIVHSCNRLGLQASPPAPSFGGWFRLR